MLARWTADFRFQSLFISFFFATLSLFLIDVIPVNNGQGYDGVLYYQIILDWSNGNLGLASEPYRLMRAGALLPYILLHTIVNDPSQLVNLSRFISIIFATLGGWFAVMACYRIGVIEGKWIKVTTLSLLSCYLLSAPVFIAPPFLSIGTDYVALFISGFSLWLWTLQDRFFAKEISLGLLAIWSVFVMPFLAAIPIVLLMFPMTSHLYNNDIFPQKDKYLQFILIMGGLSLLIAAYLVLGALTISDEKLLSRHIGWAPALLNLKFYSAIISMCIISWALFLFFVCGFRMVMHLSWVRLIGSITVFIPAILILYLVPDWSDGLEPANHVISYANIQILQAPALQIISLFSFFGPLGILGIFAISLVILTQKFRQFNAIALLGAFYLLFLSVDTETRQLIGIFPILLFMSVLVFKNSIIISLISALFAVFFIFIGWPIAANVAEGLSVNADFLDYRMQAFFGRGGPWMSPESIILFSSLLICYMTIFLGYEKFKSLKNLNEAS